MQLENESLGVVVVFNDTDAMIKGEARDLLAEQGVVACAHAIADALSDNGYRTILLPFHENIELALEPYPADQWTIFNLDEG